MKTKCPFCQVTYTLYESFPKNKNIKCSCGNDFSIEFSENKEQEKEDTLKNKLHELYLGSKKAPFHKILFEGIAKNYMGFSGEWEQAECPITFEEIKDNLQLQDYEPNTVVIFTTSKIYRKRATARLIYLILQNFKNVFEMHDDISWIRNELINISLEQLKIEKDLMIIEILCYGLENNLEIPELKKRFLSVGLAVINNFQLDILKKSSGDMLLELIGNVLPESRKIYVMWEGKGKEPQQVLEELKSKIKNEITKVK